MSRVLIINVCREKLHYLEFVRPIEEVLKKNNIIYFTRSYGKITANDLEKADKIIICGTSLKDNGYLEKLNQFSWLKEFQKPIFGICAGFQIISCVLSKRRPKILKITEIGLFKDRFSNNFLGISSGTEIETYHLHNYAVEPDKTIFEVVSRGNCVQAVKHKQRDIYGVLFHPETRQQKILENFLQI